MAMVVKNNMSAVRTLNTLNKNSSALQKSLSKVSSGMKINSAQDDASGYAISERMRVQIRSLDQANQNTQNGASMMKTAEGAVSSTVEILKSLKEKAINAANDTNTDSDRTTIQKEIDQFIDQIDDNALTTFNGKYLVDGSKNNAHNNTYATFTNQSLKEGTTGTTYLAADNTKNGAALANRQGESLEISSTDYVTASYVKDGATHTTTFRVEDNTLQDVFDKLNQQATADGGTAVFGAAQIPQAQAVAGGDPLDALSDKDLADIVANGKSSSKYTDEVGEALTNYSSTLATDVAALKSALSSTGVKGAATSKGSVSYTGADGKNYLAENTANNTDQVLTNMADVYNVTDSVTAGAIKGDEHIANQVAAWAAKYDGSSGDDAAQFVVSKLNVTITDNGTANTPVGEVVNANNADFHQVARSALLDAAKAKLVPVEPDKASLADSSIADVTASTASEGVIAQATAYNGDATDSDANVTAAATALATANIGYTNDPSKSGSERLKLMQDAINAATIPTDATEANALDTAKHLIDAGVAQYYGNQGSSGGSVADNTLVHKGTDIGTNKSGDRVDTADGTEGLTVTAATEGVKGQVSGITISISDSDGNVKKAANAALDKFAMSIRAENQTTGGKDANNNLTFQVGAEANQAISVSLTDMRSEALGLKGSDGTKVSVATQDKANAAVAVFDNAISKALDQQTTIGSIEARLEYTSQNLTTSSENVQAAESTIRDADMAKEMTNYTKNNVLLQAAQSMLAQANQSSSAVLSLLQ